MPFPSQLFDSGFAVSDPINWEMLDPAFIASNLSEEYPGAGDSFIPFYNAESQILIEPDFANNGASKRVGGPSPSARQHENNPKHRKLEHGSQDSESDQTQPPPDEVNPPLLQPECLKFFLVTFPSSPNRRPARPPPKSFTFTDWTLPNPAPPSTPPPPPPVPHSAPPVSNIPHPVPPRPPKSSPVKPLPAPLPLSSEIPSPSLASPHASKIPPKSNLIRPLPLLPAEIPLPSPLEFELPPDREMRRLEGSRGNTLQIDPFESKPLTSSRPPKPVYLPQVTLAIQELEHPDRRTLSLTYCLDRNCANYCRPFLTASLQTGLGSTHVIFACNPLHPSTSTDRSLRRLLLLQLDRTPPVCWEVKLTPRPSKRRPKQRRPKL